MNRNGMVGLVLGLLLGFACGVQAQGLGTGRQPIQAPQGMKLQEGVKQAPRTYCPACATIVRPEGDPIGTPPAAPPPFPASPPGSASPGAPPPCPKDKPKRDPKTGKCVALWADMGVEALMKGTRR